MKILAIETSCDETAVAFVEATGDIQSGMSFDVLGNALFSQVEIHKEYGGVFPAMAKREHKKNLVPLLRAALSEAGFAVGDFNPLSEEKKSQIVHILEREPELLDPLFEFLDHIPKPNADFLAVTYGPGLEPTLWVGINFARALSVAWDIPLIPTNHMEGHVISALMKRTEEGKYEVGKSVFPVLALLISGGHTELVLTKDFNNYELLGQTLDDAVGESFDKVARMMDLSYPGGPEVSKHAERARDARRESPHTLPRPMIGSGDCNFSFSGLKTAVLYLIKDLPDLSETDREDVAHEFENAVTEVLLTKTQAAIDEHQPNVLAIGGGVAANTHIRRSFETMITAEYPNMTLGVPHNELTGDNAIMIAAAAFLRTKRAQQGKEMLTAEGNLKIAKSLEDSSH